MTFPRSIPDSRRTERRLLFAALTAVVSLVACEPAVPDPSTPSTPREPAVAPRAPARFPRAVEADSRSTVVFLGNSLTAGLGVDPREAFPARVQVKIDDAGLAFRVINAGVSGETTSGGLRRLDWILDQSPDVLVVALGANDALRGAPPATVRANLQQIIDRTRARLPDAAIVIVGMLAPPNLGPTYTHEFEDVFPALAEANNLPLVPFLLEGVAADRELNQADGMHPTAAGHEILAETVWKVLEPVLERSARGSAEDSAGSPPGEATVNRR